jgi:dTDP-4-amino-4,6-dideoxygalactose transaminase
MSKRLFEQVIENSGTGFIKRSMQSLEARRVARNHRKNTNHTSGVRSNFIDDPYLFRRDLAQTRMPDLSKRILKSADWHSIVAARRENYQLISAALTETASLRKVWPHLPPGVCPWAYPVVLEDRVRFERQLRSQGVPLFTFGEVLHPLLQKSDDPTRADSEYLSSRLLALPVHQNLSCEDILHYVSLINHFFAAGPTTQSNQLSAAKAGLSQVR